MKPPIPRSARPAPLAAALLALGILLAHASLFASDTVESVLRDASAAYDRGDLVSARAGAERILKSMPGHVPSKDLLDRIARAEARAGKISAKDQLAAVTIPRTNLAGEALRDALNLLRSHLRSAKCEVNVIALDPAGNLLDRPVGEIQIGAIPATHWLDLVAANARASISYDAKSVILRPKAE